MDLKDFSGTLAGFCVVFNVDDPVLSKQFDVFLPDSMVYLTVGALF